MDCSSQALRTASCLQSGQRLSGMQTPRWLASPATANEIKALPVGTIAALS
ncbi:hypothetical protein XCR_4317 [Xanthomonas campestris pv. raphani 756C]|nr:hypothetical protein XCR_4317 [Xanthomonas campestris pv. raphani 756C]